MKLKPLVFIALTMLCTLGCGSSKDPKCNDTNSQDYKDGYIAGEASKPSNATLAHVHNGEFISSTEFSNNNYYNDCYKKGFDDAYYKKQ